MISVKHPDKDRNRAQMDFLNENNSRWLFITLISRAFIDLGDVVGG